MSMGDRHRPVALSRPPWDHVPIPVAGTSMTLVTHARLLTPGGAAAP